MTEWGESRKWLFCSLLSLFVKLEKSLFLASDSFKYKPQQLPSLLKSLKQCHLKFLNIQYGSNFIIFSKLGVSIEILHRSYNKTNMPNNQETLFWNHRSSSAFHQNSTLSELKDVRSYSSPNDIGSRLAQIIFRNPNSFTHFFFFSNR